MTVLTTAILDEEKKEKLVDEFVDSTTTPGTNIAVVTNRRTAARRPHRIFLFVITLIGLLCALGGLCYGIYHFAKLGHPNRHRVFCRVIEARPIRRTRIIAEKADLSTDGHSLRLFTPSFTYLQKIYSSSVILVIDEHDIVVIKVEEKRRCFVKQSAPRRRPHDNWAVYHWFRRLEEGSYFPNLHVLRRKWMARSPHISHIEAGRIYHPKVAEFCKSMRVYRMVEVHERVGVIPYGGGLLPKCPLRKCSRNCPGNLYVRDSNGCRTCQCVRRPKLRRPLCPPLCEMYCRYGNVRDSKGCPICKCLKGPRQKRSVEVAGEERRVKYEDSNGEVLRISLGLDPIHGNKEKVFELLDITFEHKM